MFQSDNNQHIRKKRDYNTEIQHQNNNLKSKNLKENETNKLIIPENINDHTKKVDVQNIKLENKQNITKKNNNEKLNKFKGHNSFEKKLSLIDKLDEDENSMNNNNIENTKDNMKFLKNSNKNKIQSIVENGKKEKNAQKTQTHPTQIGRAHV